MIPRKVCNLCEFDRPSFDFGWPPEGTLDLPTDQSVHQVVPGTPGHPDQFQYIDSWLLMAQTLPPRARFCTDRDRVGYLWPNHSEKKKGKKPIFQGDPVEDPVLPPQYIPLTPQAPAQPALDPLPGSPAPSVSPHHLMSKTPASSQ